jgi:hypothetical protein
MLQNGLPTFATVEANRPNNESWLVRCRKIVLLSQERSECKPAGAAIRKSQQRDREEDPAMGGSKTVNLQALRLEPTRRFALRILIPEGSFDTEFKQTTSEDAALGVQYIWDNFPDAK